MNNAMDCDLLGRIDIQLQLSSACEYYTFLILLYIIQFFLYKIDLLA